MPGRTIVTMMKDEAPFLLHWIAHHRIIGFDRIVVFTNDCSDGTDALLDRLEQMGEVTHHRNKVPDGGKAQPLALRRAMKLPEVTDSEWLIALDVDEYLSIRTGAGQLDDLLATAPQADGFALTWRMMGANGHSDWTDMPVTEAYTRGAPDLFRKGWGVKTLFQPFDNMKLGIHRPTIKGSDKSALHAREWVNGSAKPMTHGFMEGMWRSSLATLGYAHAEIAHFATQSAEAFLRRAARGNVNAKPDKYDATYYGIFNRNETEQRQLLRYAEPTRAHVAGYLADPTLSDLYETALAWHARARDALRASPDYARRMAALEEASQTPFDALDAVLFPQPLAPQGKETVAQMQAQGVPDREIARAVAQSVRRMEHMRDAEDAQELLAKGVTPDYGTWR
ncbi:glycosyltransferase family 2 protein [Gymnodinialimonas ceratoperidinii]|uniref:Glycosyltransferase family 2 protein n=1 Tax=Gymnodinialimonas ceratoperidinii TaxID=2856823 RepID=A0A8F6TZF6_9RHOB|nr:glycosyltransferase family 2 protein [Gymnodinialimonas ceratoperidinii]QXT40829.1 glycosyltransferase family 2 protein [Gymnodinialimonas ceratoperidinii]